MKKLLTIKGIFNDALTDYKDKESSVSFVVDTDVDCTCKRFKKCAICRLIEEHGLVDIPENYNDKLSKQKPDKMKTAMQLHIDDLKEAVKLIKPLGEKEMVAGLESAIGNAEHYLKKEKQVVVEAFESGLNCNVSGATGEEYYNINHTKN